MIFLRKRFDHTKPTVLGIFTQHQVIKNRYSICETEPKLGNVTNASLFVDKWERSTWRLVRGLYTLLSVILRAKILPLPFSLFALQKKSWNLDAEIATKVFASNLKPSRHRNIYLKKLKWKKLASNVDIINNFEASKTQTEQKQIYIFYHL